MGRCRQLTAGRVQGQGVPRRAHFLVRSLPVETFLIVANLAAEDFLESLSAVVRSERAALVRVAAREGLSPQDALECVQDALCTFLRLHQAGELAAPQPEWGPLLGGIVRNAARNWRRRHAVARPHEPTAESAPSLGPAADEVLLRAEAHVKLRACVAELCAVQRNVVLLRLLDERPGEDVAAALGISRGHVDVLMHRAKAALRVCMLRGDTI
jgi:RNA polymerase sigma-70 factor (ECF subfamily)